MIDLEREIRALLEEDARYAPPARDARGALRRARRRQVGVVAAAIVTVVAVIAGSAAGLAALLRASERLTPADTSGRLEAVTGSFSFGDPIVDADGAVWWIGPGLSRFDPGSGSVRTFTLADDPAFEDVWPIASAREGGVWIRSRTEGRVQRFDGEQFHQDTGPSPVCEIAEAPDGTLWGTGCSEGVFRWDGTSWMPAPSQGHTAPGAGAIAMDTEGNVWVANLRYPGPDGLGLSRFDGTTWTTWRASDGLPSDMVYTIVPGPGGEVWAGTGDGVARFTDDAWVAYAGAETGIDNVASIAVTDDGVWIAGWNGDGAGAAARFDGGAWVPVVPKDGLGTIGPSEIQQVVAGEGVVWATTNAGLFSFDGSQWQRDVRSGEGPPPDFDQIAAAGLDEVWAVVPAHRGPYPEGAWRLHGEAWTLFDEESGIPRGRVGDIAVARDGTVWVATNEGLASFDGSGWEQVASSEHGVIAFGPDGGVWTASGGFERWTVQPVGGAALPGLVQLDRVSSLAVVSDDDVWVGSAGAMGLGGGLAHFDGEGWEAVRPVAGANEFLVQDIQTTADGDVWVSVTVPVEGKRWALVVARYRGGEWTTFREADGIRLDTPFEASWGGLGQLEVTPDGDVLLATWDGLFIFRDGTWDLVVEGRFVMLSLAPDGTVWLAGDGLFRLLLS